MLKLAQKNAASLIKDKREFYVLLGRSQKAILEEIGKEFGLTREKVRQIKKITREI